MQRQVDVLVGSLCYSAAMLDRPNKWRANRGTRAVKRLVEIEASIKALSNDDLLDFADIFVSSSPTALGNIASAEMERRGISL